MRVQDTEWFKGFVRMADDGWNMGWHECNGGNLSYRIKEELTDEVKDSFVSGEWKDIGTSVPELGGEYFLITGSGKFFRNISLMPEDTLGIVEVDKSGSRYRTVWGFVNGARPTSELITHLMNHQVKKRVSDNSFRVIYHAHPSNIIALSFILPLEDEVYDLIREEVKEPVTISEIRHWIEKKYETYLSVFEEDGYTGYYYVYQSRNRKVASRKSEKYYPTFNEAMRALILEMGKEYRGV